MTKYLEALAALTRFIEEENMPMRTEGEKQ